MDKFTLYLAVGVGSALGGIGRFWLSNFTARWFGDSFPWATVLVNISGSFAIGLFAALHGPEGRWITHPRLGYFLMTGLCGGYTTFSAFSIQTMNLVQDGHWSSAGLNVLGSVVLCLAAVWLGHVS